jgi:hypothetical protein|tara:strand:- start:655 stop:843 length:189 start_codon:yes stop_codon:yes gene_type:complete
MGNEYDWQINTKGWPYSGNNEMTNKKYLKDRNKLFNENGNGWWLTPEDYTRKTKHIKKRVTK